MQVLYCKYHQNSASTKFRTSQAYYSTVCRTFQAQSREFRTFIVMHKKEGTEMGTLYERIQELCKSKGVSGSRMCLDLGLSKSTLSDMKAGRTKGVSTATAQKIANYFGVSVGYLLGEEETKNAPAVESRCVTDEDIKFALFGGSGDITDAMYEEVKSFAAYIKARGEKQAQ